MKKSGSITIWISGWAESARVDEGAERVAEAAEGGAAEEHRERPGPDARPRHGVVPKATAGDEQQHERPRAIAIAITANDWLTISVQAGSGVARRRLRIPSSRWETTEAISIASVVVVRVKTITLGAKNSP